MSSGWCLGISGSIKDKQFTKSTSNKTTECWNVELPNRSSTTTGIKEELCPHISSQTTKNTPELP